MSEETKDIDKLLLDYLDGKSTPEELRLIHHWIQEDENSKELKHISDIYLATSAIAPRSNFDSHQAWSELKNKCESSNNRKIFQLNTFLKVAAVAVIIIVSGFFAWRMITINSQENTYSEYNVPRGSRSHIYLPDGTSVWLNAQSKLRYNTTFGHTVREVILEGEAYFEVVRNEKLPFMVKASNAVVKVLGTTFNVKAYPEENFIETTVVEGKVQVSSPQIENEGKDNITLVANQKIKIIRDDIEAANEMITSQKSDSTFRKEEKIAPLTANKIDFSPNIIAHIYTSWKDAQWIIERETLKELAIKIERRYNVRIEFKDKELESFIFSGKLKDESLEQVLQAISVAAPIEYTVNQKSISFYKK